MADIVSRAVVELQVNGKEAQKTMDDLRSRAQKAREEMEKFAAAGDSKNASRKQKELERYERQMRKLQDSTQNTVETLRNLDKASLKDLNAALNKLQSQFRNMKQGTKEWERHAEAIQRVKAQIQQCNATMSATSANSHSLAERGMEMFNKWQVAIMGVVAAITGLIMAGRKAVNAYAEMDEKLADTRKFTGMTSEEVNILNDAFQRMDTRTAREMLNSLAQEAGRLGKTTQEDVLGYVKAADIINVALSDLGEGATQSIAKLSNIFKIEDKYGTYDSMVKIGSVVNVLSQNCTASKPYLVEFANRLAGVGNQAHISLQNIIGFGAVLDSNAQKVEASATAVGQVLTRMYREPAKYAKVAGLDVTMFTNLLKKDANEALLVFLETLGKAGDMDVLSPMFADMGENGARVITALSTLSKHVDEVRSQQREANKAFEEGISVLHEYEIFNNTAQAGIDKARKRITELSISLGEQLLPILSHVYTSSSIFLRVLSKMVDFCVAAKGPLTVLVIALVSYYSTVGIAKAAQAGFNLILKAGNSILIRSSVTLQVFRKNLILMAAESRRSGIAIKALNAMIALLNKTLSNKLMLISFAGTLGMLLTIITSVSQSVSGFTRTVNDAIKKAGDFDEATVKEIVSLNKLFGQLRGTKEGTEEYEDAKQNIINQYGKYMAGLIDEKGQIIDLEKAYDRLTKAVKRSAQERAMSAAQAMLDEEYYKQLTANLNSLQEGLISAGMEEGRAVEIRYSVAQAIASGQNVSPEITDEINKYGFGGGSTFLHNFGHSLDPLLSFFGIKQKKDPVSVMNAIYSNREEYNRGNNSIEEMKSGISPLRNVETGTLKMAIESLTKALEEEKDNIKKGGITYTASKNITGLTLDKTNPNVVKYGELTIKSAQELLYEYSEELALRGMGSKRKKTGHDVDDDNSQSYKSMSEAERKKAEAAARRAAVKARKEFKEELNNAKGEWEKGDARNIAERTQGLKSWTEFLTEKHRLQEKFYDDQLAIFRKHNLEEDEDYQELLKKKEQLNADWMKRRQAMAVDDAKLAQKAEEVQAQIDFSTPGSAIFQNEEVLQMRLHDIKVKYLAKMRDAYHKDSEEYYRYQLQLTEIEEQNKLEIRKKFAALYAKYSKEYAAKSAKEQLDIQVAMLTALQQAGHLSMKEFLEAVKKLRADAAELPESARKPVSAEEADSKQKALDIADVERQYAAGLKTEEEYLKAKERIEAYYDKRARERAKSVGNEFSSMVIDLYDAFKAFGEDDGEGIFGKIGHAAQAAFALMSSAMQAYSEYSKAELDAQVAKIEKRYEAEAALAEGNVYKQKAAEKKKNKEIAKAKNEANRKQFAMQVIQAVAQTAVNALNAYGSAAAVPVVGHVLAPIAAAMAVAAGMMQVATLKKQQQASESTGYRQGGFTPKGRPDEAVGVVHAGEWVAPQEIVNNPRTRPIVNFLENVRRSNRMPSISPADVSATVTAPVVAARSGAPVVNVSAPAAPAPAQADTALVSAVSRLNDRLDEPFVTVNTVTGKYGYKQAEDEYDRLIRNKSRKK